MGIASSGKSTSKSPLIARRTRWKSPWGARGWSLSISRRETAFAQGFSCCKRAILLQNRDVSESPNGTLNRYPKLLMVRPSKSYTRFSTDRAGVWRDLHNFGTDVQRKGTCSTVNARLWPQIAYIWIEHVFLRNQISTQRSCSLEVPGCCEFPNGTLNP